MKLISTPSSVRREAESWQSGEAIRNGTAAVREKERGYALCSV
jgi:hypothetical protein